MLDPRGDGLNVGDILTFGCALSFAVHIILQDKYLSSGISISHLLLTQLMFVTLFNGMSVGLFEDFTVSAYSQRLIIAILVTGVLATFIALLIMVWAQTYFRPQSNSDSFEPRTCFCSSFFYLFCN